MNNTMIPQVPGTFFVMLRQDLISLCETHSTKKKQNSKSSGHCKALILSILDYWTYDNLRKHIPGPIHITIPQWESMMYNMYKRTAIIHSLQELCEDQWISREAFKGKNGGHWQYKYTLNHELIRKLLHGSLEHTMVSDIRVFKENKTTGINQKIASMPYAEYLLTDHWKTKRQKALRFASFRCQICNGSEGLNVHHRTYERLGKELMADLTVLCQDCHAIFHKNGELTENN